MDIINDFYKKYSLFESKLLLKSNEMIINAIAKMLTTGEIDKNILDNHDNDGIYANFVSLYFNCELKDDANAFGYREIAIKKNNSEAMINHGYYYKMSKNYEKMKKYYNLAIINNNDHGLFLLGVYYKNIKEYDKMIELFLKAIDKENIYAMFWLGQYYFQQFENSKKINSIEHKLMKKYLYMAINKENRDAMRIMGNYFKLINNYEKMEDYYFKAMELDDYHAGFQYRLFYNTLHSQNTIIPNIDKLLNLAIENPSMFKSIENEISSIIMSQTKTNKKIIEKLKNLMKINHTNEIICMFLIKCLKWYINDNDDYFCDSVFIEIVYSHNINTIAFSKNELIKNKFKSIVNKKIGVIKKILNDDVAEAIQKYLI